MNDRYALEQKLRNRMARKDLVNRGIISDYQIDVAIASNLAQFQRRQTGHIIQEKISQRPTRQQLINMDILAGQDIDHTNLVRQCLTNHLSTRPGPIDVYHRLVYHENSSSTVDPITDYNCTASSQDSSGSLCYSQDKLCLQDRPSLSPSDHPTCYYISSQDSNTRVLNVPPPVTNVIPHHQSNFLQGSNISVPPTTCSANVANINICSPANIGYIGSSSSSTYSNPPSATALNSTCSKRFRKSAVTTASCGPHISSPTSPSSHNTRFKNYNFHQFVPRTSSSGGYFVKSTSGGSKVSADGSTSYSSCNNHYKSLIEQQALFLQMELYLRNQAAMNEPQKLRSDHLTGFNKASFRLCTSSSNNQQQQQPVASVNVGSSRRGDTCARNSMCSTSSLMDHSLVMPKSIPNINSRTGLAQHQLALSPYSNSNSSSSASIGGGGTATRDCLLYHHPNMTQGTRKTSFTETLSPHDPLEHNECSSNLSPVEVVEATTAATPYSPNKDTTSASSFIDTLFNISHATTATTTMAMSPCEDQKQQQQQQMNFLHPSTDFRDDLDDDPCDTEIKRILDMTRANTKCFDLYNNNNNRTKETSPKTPFSLTSAMNPSDCSTHNTSSSMIHFPKNFTEDENPSDVLSSGYVTGLPSSSNLSSSFEAPFFGFGLNNDCCEGFPSVFERVELFEKLCSSITHSTVYQN